MRILTSKLLYPIYLETILKFLILNTIFLIFKKFWLYFDKSFVGLQFIIEYNIFTRIFTFGLDGISLLFILLTAIIFSICIWYNIQKKNAIICLYLLELLLILTFYCTNLLAFYIFFESILIPMFILIIYWGSRMRKIKAAYYLFIYTMIGSFFMLYGIYYLYLLTGSLNYIFLLKTILPIEKQYVLWICFFMAFAIKIPIFPFHIWLPEAHVEAPTIGSVILASLLLKLGGYGFVRFTIPLVPIAAQYFQIIIFIVCILSILYASIITIRQIDLKKIIAYSSIAHMNVIVLGIFTLNKQGITGAIYLMIAHGITASALFFCIGMLYDRYQTRLIFYFGGLVETMPIFSFFFLIFTLSNMGFPGTCNFVGELLVLYSLIQQNLIATIFSATGIIFSAIYSIWLYNRIIFGTVKILYIQKFNDLTKLEFYILLLLTIFTFILGLNANLILDFLL